MKIINHVITAVVSCVFLQCIHIVQSQQQSFAVQPSDTDATEGSTATLRCSVANKAGMLTWTRGNTPLSVDSRIIDSANTRYSIVGDTATGTFDLQIDGAVPADSGQYQCLVTAAGVDSEILSDVATLTVLQVQSFIQQPGDTSVSAEATATLQCQVQNKEGFLYWLKDGQVMSNDTTVTNENVRYSIIGDQTAGQYDLQIVSTQKANDEGSYRCVVTEAGTSPRIESGLATLSIQASGQRLIIVPSDAVFTEGTAALMRCKVVDKAGSLSWLQNSQPISFDGETSNGDPRYSIVGDRGAGEYNLQITGVSSADMGTYHCIVSGAAGEDNGPISSSGATLTVLPATAPDSGYPRCTLVPSSDLHQGDNVTISCTSRGGKPQPSLVWLRDGLEFDAGRYTALDLNARNEATFQLSTDLVGVVFECLSSHPAYSTTHRCQLDPLIFELTPTIQVNLDVLTLEIKEDGTGSVVCTASGDPPVIGFSWYYNGVQIAPTDDRFLITAEGITKSTLTVTSASLSMDESVVSCEARNRIDKESVYAVVRIIKDNLFKFVLAVLSLIALVIFALIVVPIVVYYFYRRHKKKMKVAPVEDGPTTKSETKVHSNYNHFVTNETIIPNGTAKGAYIPNNAAALPHEYKPNRSLVDEAAGEGSYGSPTPLPDLAGRSRYSQPVRSQTPDGYPMESFDSALSGGRDTALNGWRDSALSGRRGSYDLETARARPDTEIRGSIWTLRNNAALPPSSIKEPDLEPEAKELEARRKSLASSVQDDLKSRKSRDGGERRKHHKHKKRDKEGKKDKEEKKDRDEKRDKVDKEDCFEEGESHKKSKSKEHREHRDKKDKKERRDKKEKRERKKESSP